MNTRNSRVDTLVAELEILADTSQIDFDRKFWDNYKNYITDYNRLVDAFHEAGINTGSDHIEEVPDGLRSEWGTGTSEEQAKLREIAHRSKILLLRTRPYATPSGTVDNPQQLVEQICTRFHLIARQLQHRHSNRATLEVNDEYDVQDLLHALLRLDFEDIRPEEWTPSYAGASGRMDFLLKQERIVVEVKKTRMGLAHREVGEQLIVDIERYKNHPDCKLLVCFVYDPEGRIGNPRGVENDLQSRSTDDLLIRVLIRP